MMPSVPSARMCLPLLNRPASLCPPLKPTVTRRLSLGRSVLLRRLPRHRRNRSGHCFLFVFLQQRPQTTQVGRRRPQRLSRARQRRPAGPEAEPAVDGPVGTERQLLRRSFIRPRRERIIDRQRCRHGRTFVKVDEFARLVWWFGADAVLGCRRSEHVDDGCYVGRSGPAGSPVVVCLVVNTELDWARGGRRPSP